MGTFHNGKGELHGITVVVEAPGDQLYVGRCDTHDERGIALWDVDRHEAGGEGLSHEQWLARVLQVGHWPREKRLVLPPDQVLSVKPLSAFEAA